MEPKIRFITAESEDDNFTLIPRVIDELPKLNHSADDAAYMDWLNTILLKRDQSNIETIPTEAARHALE